MCGRFILLTDLSVIVDAFGIQEVACHYRPDRNFAPGQEIAAVIHDDRNRLVHYRWGLIPSWAKDASIGNGMFNARAETIAKKPSFREAFKKRRCLIPVDGFYEWQKTGRMKKPLRFYLQSEEPFGLAGLHETWISPEKKTIRTCTVITTEANDLLRPIHDRMPVIVAKQRQAEWIDPDNSDEDALLAVLKPYPSGAMAMCEVDPSLFSGPVAREPFLDGLGNETVGPPARRGSSH